MIGEIEKSRDLRWSRQKGEGRLKAEKSQRRVGEKRSFSWRLSSKSTLFPPYCRGGRIFWQLCFSSSLCRIRSFLVPLHSRFLRSPYHHQVFWVAATFYKVRDFLTPMRTCILEASLFLCFFSFSFPQSLCCQLESLFPIAFVFRWVLGDCIAFQLLPAAPILQIVSETIGMMSILSALKSARTSSRFGSHCYMISLKNSHPKIEITNEQTIVLLLLIFYYLTCVGSSEWNFWKYEEKGSASV